MELVMVTGMSGAGKSQAIHLLEDIGFYCVDNLPPQMIGKFIELCETPGEELNRVAIVVDVRGRGMFLDFIASLHEPGGCPRKYKLLFLDAEDSVLLKRYKEGRRRHPLLEAGGSLQEAIAAERQLLSPVRRRADYIVDTSQTAVSQLREQLVQIFTGGNEQAMLVQCMSFGFKHGLPSEADLVFDVRCLPNPFYVPELREHTGLEEPVRRYVMQFPQSRELLERLEALIDFLLPLYVQEGKSQLVIAVGCTGGKHRSVAFAQAIGSRLLEQGVRAVICHRDKDKPAAR
ncbi:MAG: RNase adapter RapZ [Provencibacterium sp.]|jgi:UPF0042 nucleotide-binding protein|nr:RNase adapter RapZ [Provencibacterium sp.]